MGELRAAGFVVFRRITNQVQFLLLKASYKPYHWTPPKGHVDPGESDMETALRETEEEAGLAMKDLKVTSFTKTLQYEVRGRPKSVVYWAAELINPECPVSLSKEHTAFDWLPLNEAKPRVEYEEMQVLLQQCQDFINSCSQ